MLLENISSEEARVMQSDDSEVPDYGQTRHEVVAMAASALDLNKPSIFEHFATINAADEQVAEQ